MEFLEFGSSFAILKPSDHGAGQAVLSRLLSLFFFNFAAFFLDWDLEHCWILGIIQQAVAMY